MSESNVFQALMLSLPAHNSTLRMRLWRALKATGCGVLRDGVYVLPADAPQVPALNEVEAEVKSAGGFAMTCRLAVESAQTAEVRKLFDRGAEYGALVQDIKRTKTGLKRLGKRKAETAVQRLRRAFDELAAIDFYPGEAYRQAKDALAFLELEARELFAEGEPRSSKSRVRRLDPAKYRGRTWATRKAPWIDRLACAWFIRRFIDKNAKLLWIEKPRDCPKSAIGYDFDGAEFTHEGPRVTFEVLVASFGFGQDPALASIGAAVHFLDVGGIAVADAKGVETLLTGLKSKTRGDDELVREAAKIFELLYEAYASDTGRAGDSMAA